ncbi:MAG: hypothetical protein Q9168_004479 [Polycauliona sp. 1 TL-2023]
MDDHIPREAYLSSMAGRTTWSRSMLQLLIDMGQQGLSPQQMLGRLQGRFGGKPKYVGEVVAEYAHLRTGPKPSQWNLAMEARLKQYLAEGMDVNDITTELFHEFAKPDSGYWQETYRKVQEMRLEGVIQ